MRPAVGGDALTSRSRKHSFAEPEATTPTAIPGNGIPTAFFMASGDSLDTLTTYDMSSGSESTFGVQSLGETLADPITESLDRRQEEEMADASQGRRRSTFKTMLRHGQDCSLDSLRQASVSSTANSSPIHFDERPWPPTGVSQPLTPLSLASPAQSSPLPSSPQSSSVRSYKNSDEEITDDGASQAIVSSEEEENDSVLGTQGVTPQLIMPSIKMPSRRPFTERGKNMGRLKVLIAGDSGIGKTSLIKSIVQTCEDIVHVDPLSSNPPSLESLTQRKSTRLSHSARNSTRQIIEVYASTRPYPSWWSEIDESKILRRRKSIGETVLERNICFIDTPGYSYAMSKIEGIEAVVQYIETQMAKTLSATSLSDGDLLNLLGGDGGVQVDVVFYLISQKIKPVDLEFLKRVSPLTNFIPLIAKADSMSEEEIRMTKARVSSKLYSEGLTPFSFRANGMTAVEPITVCSASSDDEENMDASLLMSPDYVQPLLPSELALLVDQVFEKDNVSWLRHSSAKKVIQWHKTSHYTPTSSYSPLSSPLTPLYGRSLSSNVTPPSSTTSQAIIAHPNGASSFFQARITDHTQREERLAQIRLAKWASDLQRSLRNERARCEALVRGQRAIWLTERIGDCIADGTLVPVQESAVTARPSPEKYAMALRPPSAGGSSAHYGLPNLVDPLGIIRWNDAMKKRGWLAFQVVGSFGVLGAIAVWVARNWGEGLDGAVGMAWNWGWLSGGGGGGGGGAE